MNHAVPALLCVAALWGCTATGERREVDPMQEPATAGTRAATDAAIAWFETDVLGTGGASMSSAFSLLNDDSLQLFVDAGRDVVPMLCHHVSDARYCKIGFTMPGSSGIAGPLRVGEVTAYLIEVALRREQYFCGAGQLDESLDTASAKYAHWVERCFDKTTGAWRCPTSELPGVAWR